MLVYAILMFVTAVATGLIAVLIHKGKTELIHDYHQKKVEDKAAYGKAFGKALGVLAGAMLLSGVIALFGEAVMWGAVAVLVVGMIASVAAIACVQKKYNGSIF